MMTNSRRVDELRELWAHPAGQTTSEVDFSIIATSSGIHVARSRSGDSTLVIELHGLPEMSVGRRAAGCELVPYPVLDFVHEGRRWSTPAAALVCTEPDLLDIFVVLAADIECRMQGARDWRCIVAAVQDWQSLLTPRGRPNFETQMGLWGELWLITTSSDPDLLLSAWRGPERDSTDFLLNGKTVEVKASRQRRQHHVSTSQISDRVDGDAWLLSMWLGVDPIRGSSLPNLVEQLLARVIEPAAALRGLARAGYVHADRLSYDARFALLAEPEWYALNDVPRVRSVDPGISRLRYLVSLDGSRAFEYPAPLWRHFLGCDYGSL